MINENDACQNYAPIGVFLLKLTPTSNIFLEGFISLFVSYWPPLSTMDAFSATIDTGGRALIRLNICQHKKIISTLIY